LRCRPLPASGAKCAPPRVPSIASIKLASGSGRHPACRRGTDCGYLRQGTRLASTSGDRRPPSAEPGTTARRREAPLFERRSRQLSGSVGPRRARVVGIRNRFRRARRFLRVRPRRMQHLAAPKKALWTSICAHSGIANSQRAPLLCAPPSVARQSPNCARLGLLSFDPAARQRHQRLHGGTHRRDE